MTALPSPGNVLKVQLVWTIGPSTGNMNVLHYSYTGGRPNATDLNSLCSAFGAAMGTAQKALWSTQVTLTTVIATDLQGNDGLQGTASPAAAGTDIRQVLPASACVVQSCHVQARYRGGHPRIYWPGFTVGNSQDNQKWSASILGSANTTLTQLLASIVGQTYGTTAITNQVAVSYYHDKALRATPLVLPIQSRTLVQTIGSQRKRLHG